MKGYVILVSTLLLSGCWFDFNSEIWTPDLIRCTQGNTLDFGSNIMELPLHYEYRGDYNAEYTISSNVSWISILDIATNNEIQSGLVNQNQNKLDFKVVVDRSKMEEGINYAEIKFKVDDIVRNHVVSANADANIIITPNSLNFGMSDTTQELYLSSETSDCLVKLSMNVDWLNVSSKILTLKASTSLEEHREKIIVSCDRSSLTTGIHQGCLSILSEKETFRQEIPVTIYVQEQDELIQSWTNFIFTISETPYRTTNGSVAVKVNVTNASNIYSSISLDAYKTKAYDIESNTYNSYGNQTLLLKAGETKTLTITFESVPEIITSFTRIVLDFTETRIEFENLSF